MAQSIMQSDESAPYALLRGALQHMMLVANVAELLVAEPDFAKRMRLLTRTAATVGMGHAALFLHEPVTEALVPLAVVNGLNPTPVPFSGAQSGLTPQPLLAALPLSEGIAGHTALKREIVCIHNLQADPHWQTAMAAPDAAVLGIAPRAIIALPLLDRDTLLGVLEVAQAEQCTGFDPRTIDLLKALAAQATLALTIERRDSDLRLERQHAVDAQEDERRRLARDLHDGPVQSVANAAMTLEYIDKLLEQRPAEARTEIRQLYTRLTRTMRELRGVLFDLRPLALDAEGLTVALPYLIERVQEEHGPQIRLTCDLPTRLPTNSETTIYLIVREALTNVVKHAQATACWVEVHAMAPSDLTNGQRAVQVLIRDNGVGFDADAVLAHYPRGQSWGLLNMFERARMVTERFAIRSHPGQGTSVEMQVPVV